MTRTVGLRKDGGRKAVFFLKSSPSRLFNVLSIPDPRSSFYIIPAERPKLRRKYQSPLLAIFPSRVAQSFCSVPDRTDHIKTPPDAVFASCVRGSLVYRPFLPGPFGWIFRRLSRVGRSAAYAVLFEGTGSPLTVGGSPALRKTSFNITRSASLLKSDPSAQRVSFILA